MNSYLFVFIRGLEGLQPRIINDLKVSYKKNLTQNRFFEVFMILTISANCIVLALEEYLPNKDRTERTQKLVSKQCF